MLQSRSSWGDHTGSLEYQRKDIASHKDFGEPSALDDGMRFTLRQQDDSAQDHVDGCCHQGGCDQDQEVLHDEWSHGPAARIFNRIEDSADVPDAFACVKIRLATLPSIP